MVQIAGLIIVVALVFGGLFLTSGPAILEALPYEFALIAGAALGTLLIGNSITVAREALTGFAKTLRGSKWQRNDYVSLLALLHNLTSRARRGGIVAIEADIETPQESVAYQAATAILNDQATSGLICETFRILALDLADTRRAEEQMDRSIEGHVSARMQSVSALHTMADALPALGIVAAVLGIIRTMGAIDQSPAILGAMIGTALLGTFLGVFLAYGIVGPVAARYGQIIEEEAQMMDIIRVVLSAHASGIAPRSAVELGRTSIEARLQPAAETLDHQLQAARFTARQAQSA